MVSLFSLDFFYILLLMWNLIWFLPPLSWLLPQCLRLFWLFNALLRGLSTSLLGPGCWLLPQGTQSNLGSIIALCLASWVKPSLKNWCLSYLKIWERMHTSLMITILCYDWCHKSGNITYPMAVKLEEALNRFAVNIQRIMLCEMWDYSPLSLVISLMFFFSRLLGHCWSGEVQQHASLVLSSSSCLCLGEWD